MSHTPTPWSHKPTAGHDVHGQSVIWDEQGKSIALVYTDAEDAAFIEKAANSHAALVACAQALKDIINAADGYAPYDRVELIEDFAPYLSDLYESGVRLPGED